MADRPPINDFNPTGTRFIYHPADRYNGGDGSGGPSAYRMIYRWDPPGGYNPVAVVRGMQGVYAQTMAEELCAWYNERYPLPTPVEDQDFQMEKVNHA